MSKTPQPNRHTFPSRRCTGIVTVLFSCLSVLLLCGCAGPQVRLDLHATPLINPSEEGQALPVVVRVYQLKDPRGFQESPFEDLWKQDLESLGADALGRQELVMQPGSSRELALKRLPGATHLGILAIFRDPASPAWRDIRALPGGRLGRHMDQRLSVSLHGSRILIED
ncbi:type VI secretion system lipoprotein TssJ [Ectothiorhodospira lacustris]|uniref:type VI secretion system lipoprotein TssJ n=1 Tax=Ectothiorhodospira lacustris TaxID=2899127 RepID=UPI001EE78861|nr:type VI secretion system lipoprotein TssJ [Ectothiorhodospira lacustris]MCG5499367.1 type VI secretion system lipoprotein TssJ [Ectothiorhodospira lacustris]MCG5509256.1 type VI secretion system lipoprotein TssJ [Ectothiorhodospira lacustris]MCG5521046.1 type VI secretion system lipoprotein TssJ [Ectothiorhodospira lacustris]